MMRAIELGLHLNKPWGEVMPYDFAVEHEGQFVRVPVKSTMFIDREGIRARCGGAMGRMREIRLIMWRRMYFRKTCGTSFRRSWWWDRGALRCIRS